MIDSLLEAEALASSNRLMAQLMRPFAKGRSVFSGTGGPKMRENCAFPGFSGVVKKALEKLHPKGEPEWAALIVKRGN